MDYTRQAVFATRPKAYLTTGEVAKRYPVIDLVSDSVKREGRLRREVEIEPSGVGLQGIEETVDAVDGRRVKLLQLARPV